MPIFPRTDAEIRSLAHSIIAGLTANPADFPSPTVPPATLQTKLDTFETADEEVNAARSAYLAACQRKEVAREDLVVDMKTDLRYGEDAVKRNDAKLNLLGWAARSPRKPRLFSLPGQPRELVIGEQGEGWLELSWKKPMKGGKLLIYRIERRGPPEFEWTMVGNATDTEVTLIKQERMKNWEYRVIAVNKAGDGPASNTVAAVV